MIEVSELNGSVMLHDSRSGEYFVLDNAEIRDLYDKIGEVIGEKSD